MKIHGCFFFVFCKRCQLDISVFLSILFFLILMAILVYNKDSANTKQIAKETSYLSISAPN